MNNQILKVVHGLALLCLLLTVGVFWGHWMALTRSYHLLSLSELIHVGQVTVKNLAVPMRFISIATVVVMAASAWLEPDKKAVSFYFKLASMACLIIPLALTVILEVPINNQVISWTPATAPAHWEVLRDQWQHINSLRVIFSVLSFVCFTLAVVNPFHYELKR